MVKKNGHHGRRRFYEKEASVYLHIEDIRRRRTKGFIKLSRNLNRLKARFLILTETNRRLYRSLKVIHNNILVCYSIHRRKRREIFAYENFVYTLKDISGEATKFWKCNIRGEITSMTTFFRSLCVTMLTVVIFLNRKNISHQNIGSLENIVFCEDDEPKLYNFSCASTGGLRGLCKDLQGIVSMIESVMKRSNVTHNDIPLELKSFINLLSNYQGNIDVKLLKDHPVLLHPKERKIFILKARDHLKLDTANYRKWERFLNVRRVSPALCDWKTVVKSEACLRSHVDEYYNQPGSLVNFVRNTYTHINDGLKVVRYTDVELEQIFLGLFPNLFIEWFFYIHKINSALNIY